MRISVLKTDPGYDELAHLYRVLFNGKYIEKCVTADEEHGFVLIRESKNQYKEMRGDVRLDDSNLDRDVPNRDNGNK
jgi:hypothetical protein